MPEINANFVVETIGLTIDQTDPGITVTPEVINMTLYTAGYAVPGGNVGDLQYNAGGYIGGIPTANYISNNLNLGNVNAVKILGGTNTYFLQTDGTGNLTFAPGTVVANTGNGIASGANTQIQITDGTGNFVSAPGFTFDYLGNTLSVPGAGLFTGNITSGNANLGNLATANYFSGNFIGTLANGTSNIRIFANSNIAFSVAGNANTVVFTDTQLLTSNANIGMVYGNANLTTLRVNSGELALGFQAAGSGNQNFAAIAFGYAAGIVNQGAYGIAIGKDAGGSGQGSNAIAIGHFAGYVSQGANSIIINATGANLSPNTANAFFVKPIRNSNTANVLFYDNSSGEITYSNTLPTANYANFAGQVTNTAQPNITSVGTLTGLTVSGAANFTGNVNITSTATVQQIKEKVVANSTGSTGTINFDLLTSAIILKTVDATANFTLNFRGNSTTTLDNTVSSNESITCTYINQNGSTAYVLSGITVDSSVVAPIWSGPNANVGNGTVNGKDMYTFNIIKTAANTYTVFATRNGFA